MSQQVGTGPEGLVVPGDLDDDLADEAAALGNGEDIPEESAPEAVAAGNGKSAADDGEPGPATGKTGEDRDWTAIDRHSDRVGATGWDATSVKILIFHVFRSPAVSCFDPHFFLGFPLTGPSRPVTFRDSVRVRKVSSGTKSIHLVSSSLVGIGAQPAKAGKELGGSLALPPFFFAVPY